MSEEIIINDPAILPAHWRYRPNTWDWNIFDSVCLHNEYALPNPLPPHSLILDVGAHIGSFSWACHMVGAEAVVAYEMCRANFGLLKHNLAPLPKARAVHAAVWNTSEAGDLHEPDELPLNTGGCGPLGQGVAVKSVSVRQAIDDALAFSGLERVRLLKLDCEGSEYPILAGADLSRVDALCGEFHDGFQWQGRTWTAHDAVPIIQAAGFAIRVIPTAPGFSIFWADKPSFYEAR